MSEGNRRTRPYRVYVYVTKDELNNIRGKAKKAGLNIGEYVRRTLDGETIVMAPPADFSTLIFEIRRVGSNLNQLVRRLNTTGDIDLTEVEKCIADIQETQSMLYRTFRPGKEVS